MGPVRNIVRKANLPSTVQLAAVLLAGSTLLSSALGFLRENLLNNKYLHSYPTGIDAYTVAFVIPDFMFFILVSGALSVTFIPVFNQRLKKGNKKSAWELSTSMINFMALITLVASVLIIIFADPLVRYVIGPGLDEASRSLAISMMRVIAVNPFLFAIATVIASMQQAIGRFTFYALAPTIYNIGIIIGTVFFTNGINIFGWQIFDGGIMGVALGVVLGSAMQLIVSSLGLLGLGFDYQFKIFWKNKGFRRVLRLLPARSLDQGMDYIVGIVETNLASRMASSTVRVYQQASTLHLMPINLIGVAISTAAYPRMTQRLSEGRPDLFKKEFLTITRVIIWLALPIAIITFFCRGFIASFIVSGGDPRIATVLGYLVIAMLFRSVYHIAARSFYAQQDTKTPLYVSIFSIALNVILAVWFTMHFDFGVYGLAWAQSIVATFEVIILFVLLGRRMRGLFDGAFFHAIGRMAISAAVMGIVTYITVQLLQLQNDDRLFQAILPKFVFITLLSAATYVFAGKLLKLKEVDPVLKRIDRILFNRVT